MTEYIERESLVQAIEDSWRSNPHSDPKVRKVHNHEHQHFLVLASKQPTADVVPIVRCKDCKYCEHILDEFCKDWYQCKRRGNFAQKKADDYCSYGERKI